MQDQNQLGWRIGTFVEDTYRPHATFERTSSQIWEDYRRWCASRALTPLALLQFTDLFRDLVTEVGIPVRQIGGNVVYVGLELRHA